MSAQASSSQAPPFRIFLSHAGEDKETVARPLYERLKKHGLSVFFDEESFRLGDDCPTVMKHAMQTAPVGVFIMSPQFVAKQWPMRELMAFVRRLDHAKQHHETPPLLIPIFYRFSTNECRDPAILETHGSLFLRHGLFQRIWSGEIRVEDVKHALDTAATVWSIRNDIGATNSDKPDMVHTRKLFISTVQNRILDKLGVERREFSESVPSAIYTQPPEQDQYTSCNTVPSNPPRLTLNYDSQTTYEGKLRAAILGASESRIVAVLATGKGGVGKTCALKGLAEDNEIKREFGGGILYMELGNDATLRDVVHGIANIVKRTGGAKLSKLIRTMESVADASQEASEWFGERRCLFLVDDIWRVNGVDSDVLDDMGRIVGTKSRMVYTTRDKQFIHDAADWIEFKERETHGELSRQMLMTHAGFDVGVELNENNKKAFEYFLTLCQGLPLGFSIIGRLVRERSWECSVREDGWFEFYNEVFLQQDVLMKTKAKSYGPIPRIVDSSLFVLNKRNKHGKHGYWFRALSVLQKQQSVPDKMLQKLWSLGTLEETRAVVKSFCDVSVVEMTRKEGEMCVKLHDLILDVAVHQAGEKNETESFFQTLVHNYMACSDGKDKSLLQRRAMSSADWETCCAWWKVKDDGYVRHNICRILRMGGYAGQLLWLLSQPQWIVSRLVGDGILSLEQDLEHGRAVCGDHGLQQADHKEHLQMIGRAGRMSAVFVNNNACAEEGWFQLHGRLQWHATLNELTKQFVEKMEKCAPRPWLKASAGLLQQAGGGGAQIVTVPGEVRGTHEERDTIWILSGDYGRMCVGRYNTRNESYRETWLEMDDCVEVGGASFLRDGRRAVTAHRGGRFIRVWNTTSGECLNTVEFCFETHRSFINFMDHGTLFACQSADRLVELCDTLSGEPVSPPLRGHKASVTCVALSADGGRIVSGSYDHTVRVWDAHTGVAVGQPLQGHTDMVTCVAFSADRGRIVSGSEDQTVRVWDAHTGRAVGEPLQGHSGWVNCVAFSADGSRIVSGSEDQTVRVWDAHTGSAVGQPLDSHTYGVTRLALSADGSCIVSEDTEMQYLWRVNAGSYNCLLTSQDAEWQRTIDALELTWSEKKSLPARQRWVKDFAEDGSEVVLGNCEEGVFNVRGGDVYFAIDVGRNCRILR
eukprot:TRINITY_DN68_c0_g1_i11.p1 TRINITY_DN68_c0_g1~~TRINITY_DN68_c0_g1_i11.p1  ORF type:complete len:1153 (+),score=198.74 TRINITY_DN68_c0_g1_i11:2850-6308(+)